MGSVAVTIVGMSGTELPSPGPARESADRAPLGRAAHVWVRSLPAWHVYNVAVIVGATITALASGTISGLSVAAAVALAALMVAGYWAMFVRPRPWEWLRPAAVYALGLSVVFGLLMQLSPYFGYLEFTLYPQIFFLLHLRRRAVVVGAIGIGVAMTLGDLAMFGWNADAAASRIATDLMTDAFAFAISMWIGSIARQSVVRQQLIDELDRTRAELAASERQAGVLEERARLAREIHDTLAQGFASIITHLEAAEGSLEVNGSRDVDAERADRHIREAAEVARQSLAEARGLAWAIRPDTLAGGGLVAAIERVAKATSAAAPDLSIQINVTGTAVPLHPTVEVTLLRAAQEALANVRRHSKATEVTVTLSYFEDAVNLDIADNGVGFLPTNAAPSPGGGLGLVGMRERAEALGGDLSIESAPGHGTTVAVSLPALPVVSNATTEPTKPMPQPTAESTPEPASEPISDLTPEPTLERAG